MEKTYDPTAIESHWYKTWEDAGYFSPQGQDSSYCIMLPPPNITGSLHMGHAFQHTLIDILIRYHRMLGDKTLWQCGTDHAGIATQMVVERQLEQQGSNRHALGRERFTKVVWDWKAQSGSTITNQLRRLGTSMDWSRERFTLDEGLSKAVNEVFVQLYNEGLIYRGERLVNWDPVLRTAISDLEVISEQEDGHMWHIRYPRVDDQGYVIVATTRPETMFGDAAVAVHPDDPRYQDLIGKKVLLPLVNRPIPVIADKYVDPEFGTGCVKITPAHDFNDYEVWRRHDNSGTFEDIMINGKVEHREKPSTFDGVPLRGLYNIFKEDAALLDWDHVLKRQKHELTRMRGYSEEAAEETIAVKAQADFDKIIPPKYQGIDRYEARKQIISDLQADGLLEKTEPHTLMVPRSDRSGAVVEPYLTKQWYIKVASLAEPAIQAVKQGDIKFVPDHWHKTYFAWMDNIQDWCISRQLWWGHRIPAWYDNKENVYVGRSEEDVRKNCFVPQFDVDTSLEPGLPDDLILVQDEDVLDTWFSSALWCFSTLDWPQETEQLKDFYPTSVLVTGFDIIFFWVARMIMMSLKFTGKVPFKEVYIHGLVRDAQGQKMSKSKGNVLDPIDLIDGINLETLVKKRTSGLLRPKDATKIEQVTRQHFPAGIAAYGTDSLRITFASLATQGRDINFDVGRIGGYRNFCNKLWNASRYVILSMEDHTVETDADKLAFGLAERWIMTRLAQTIEQVTKGMDGYRFDLAVQAIHEFTWDEYCDWYLEFSKIVLTNPHATAAEQAGTRLTLLRVLEILLRMAHPFIPFISEEIWQRIAPMLGKQGETIMQASYPVVAEIRSDQTSLEEIAWVKLFILGVRRIRSTRDIPPSKVLPVSVKGGSELEKIWLQANMHYITAIANSDTIDSLDIVPDDAVLELAGEMILLVPLADLIDPQVELVKLAKELQKLQQNSDNIAKKLANEKFVVRAPAEVVAKERQRLQKNKLAIEKLEEGYQRIKKLTA